MSNSEDRLDSGGLLYVFQRLKTILTGMFPSKGSVIDVSEKGAANGVAELDSTGKVPSSQLPAYPDISGKADKVSNATEGNFASLDSSGNLADSGHKHSDYLTKQWASDGLILNGGDATGYPAPVTPPGVPEAEGVMF